METPEHIRQQRIVGGNVALDLLNTQNGTAGEPPEDDVLRDYGDLVAWSHHVGMLGNAEAERLLRRSRRRPHEARAALERTRETRTYLYSIFDAVARGSAPPASRGRPAAARRGRGVGACGARARRRRLHLELGARCRPGQTALARCPRGVHAAHDRSARSGQGLRIVPLPLPRREQESKPALVLDGGLRHRRQDAQVRGPSRGCEVRAGLGSRD